MARAWYILQTYSQFELKVERTIRIMMDDGTLGEGVHDVKVPSEKSRKTKWENGSKKKSGFGLDISSWRWICPTHGWKDVISPIRRINGVSGFVGATGKHEARAHL
jgi:transcriptional antiterminator NusG